MSATDELRKLLDERGVEYYKHEDGEPLRELHEGRDDATSWRVGCANVCAVPFDDYTFDLWIDHATPEQAITATLGRGECENVSGVPLKFTCSKCEDSWSIPYDGFNYCPSCGLAVKQ